MGRTALLLAILSFAAACGSDDGDDGGGASTAVCADIGAKLDAVNATTQCPKGGEVLKGMCESGLSSKPSCESAVRALHDCAKDQPDSEWGCHSVGEYPRLINDACAAEDDAVEACFSG
jgi:hypothetical protein